MNSLPGRRGWTIVWVAFIVAMFAWGLGFYGPSVFLQTLHAEHGWSISIISTAITVHYLLSAAIIVYLPELHRMFGIAAVTIAGVVLLALGVNAWANVSAPWQLFPAAVLSGVGWAVTSGAAINTMVAPWFDRDRPKALGLAFNGASFGGVVFTPLWAVLISRLGFSMTALLLGIAMVVIVAPLAARFLRHGPSGTVVGPTAQPVETISRAALLLERRFVTLSAAFSLGLFAQIGLVTHIVARLAPDFGATGAAGAVSFITLCAVAGRSLVGWFIGERDRRIAAAVNFLVQAAGVLLLSFSDGLFTLGIGCALFGLGVGNLISLPPLIAQKEFEPGSIGIVVAMTVAINQAVFAMAPAAFGLLRDMTADYTIPFILVAAIQVGAAIIIFFGRR